VIENDKNVLNLPQLELFVGSQSGDNLLATYSHGNGTNKIHFQSQQTAVLLPKFQIVPL
jgi:hypothetical protein